MSKGNFYSFFRRFPLRKLHLLIKTLMCLKALELIFVRYLNHNPDLVRWMEIDGLMIAWRVFPFLLISSVWFCLFWVEVGHSTRNKLLFVPLWQDEDRGTRMERTVCEVCKGGQVIPLENSQLSTRTRTGMCVCVNSC